MLCALYDAVFLAVNTCVECDVLCPGPVRGEWNETSGMNGEARLARISVAEKCHSAQDVKFTGLCRHCRFSSTGNKMLGP